MTPAQLETAREQLAPYGYARYDDGTITKGDRLLSVKLKFKKGRFEAWGSGPTKLWSGPDAGFFVKRFYYAEKIPVGPARPGQRFERGDVAYETQLIDLYPAAKPTRPLTHKVLYDVDEAAAGRMGMPEIAQMLQRSDLTPRARQYLEEEWARKSGGESWRGNGTRGLGCGCNDAAPKLQGVTLTYGKLPSHRVFYEAFAQHVTGPDYKMQLNASDWKLVERDMAFAGKGARFGDSTSGHVDVLFDDIALLRLLQQMVKRGSEKHLNFVSNILQTLDIEWV